MFKPGIWIWFDTYILFEWEFGLAFFLIFCPLLLKIKKLDREATAAKFFFCSRCSGCPGGGGGGGGDARVGQETKQVKQDAGVVHHSGGENKSCMEWTETRRGQNTMIVWLKCQNLWFQLLIVSWNILEIKPQVVFFSFLWWWWWMGGFWASLALPKIFLQCVGEERLNLISQGWMSVSGRRGWSFSSFV